MEIPRHESREGNFVSGLPGSRRPELEWIEIESEIEDEREVASD